MQRDDNRLYVRGKKIRELQDPFPVSSWRSGKKAKAVKKRKAVKRRARKVR